MRKLEIIRKIRGSHLPTAYPPSLSQLMSEKSYIVDTTLTSKREKYLSVFDMHHKQSMAMEK